MTGYGRRRWVIQGITFSYAVPDVTNPDSTDYGFCSPNTTFDWRRSLNKHQLYVKSNTADGTYQGQCSETELTRATITNLRTNLRTSTEMASSSAASSHSAAFIWIVMLLEATIMAFLYISLESQPNYNLHTEQAFFSYYLTKLKSSFYILPRLIKVTRQALPHQDTKKKIKFDGARERKTTLSIGKASKCD